MNEIFETIKKELIEKPEQGDWIVQRGGLQPLLLSVFGGGEECASIQGKGLWGPSSGLGKEAQGWRPDGLHWENK